MCPGLLFAIAHVSLLLDIFALPDRMEILLCRLRNANKYVDCKTLFFVIIVCDYEMLFLALLTRLMFY